MRNRFVVSFVVAFVALGGAMVGASLSKFKAIPDFSTGSTGHTTLTPLPPTETACITCHAGPGVTANFTNTAGTPVTATQLYPGETGTFNIRATLTSTFSGSAPYRMGANIATNTNAGYLTSTEPAIIKTGFELQHHDTTAGPLKTVVAGGSNSYSFFYTLTNTAIGVTSTIAGVSCVDYPGGGQNAPEVIVTSRRPADPTSITPSNAASTSVVLDWLSNGPLNRIIVKTGTFATSPTDTTGTAYDIAGSTTTISGLNPVTTYFFKLWGHSSYSSIDTYSTNAATTTAMTTLPLAATGLTVSNITRYGFDLSWTGTSPEFRAIYKANSVPTGPTDGTLITEGTGTTATVSGLASGTRYFVAVYGKASGSSAYSATAPTTSLVTGAAVLIASDGSANGPWDRRGSPIRLGKMIYGDSSGNLNFFNGTTVSTLQAKGAFGMNPNTVFDVGTAATPGQVIATWRRDDAYVSIDGGTPVTINAANPVNPAVAMNAEVITIDGGCVFAVFRATSGGFDRRNAFRVDPSTGNSTALTNNTTVYGVNHMSNSGCTAAWSFNDDTGSDKLQYYNGSTVTQLDSGVYGDPSISQGRIVYAKTVAPNRREIFLYDTTAASPAPVQLTNDLNTKTNEKPFTDGRHIAWVRSNTGGTSPEIMLNGGLQLTGNMTLLDNMAAPPFDLDRGQLLWRDTAGLLHLESSASSTIVDYGPASSTSIPWLADGSVAFFDTTPNPFTVFRFTGPTPTDAQQPSAPLLVRATPGTGSVVLKWDAILGATSYNVYYATQPGVTKANYASLGGTRITGITSPTFTVSGLTPNAAYYFVITTVDPSGEGPESRQASTVVIGTPSWSSVGSLGTTAMYGLTADRTTGNAAYASGGNNTYASTNSGQTWSLLGGGIAGINVHGLAANAGTVFATAMNGSIYRSTNAGASWSAVASGIADSFTQSIVIDPAVPSTILASDFRLPSFTGGGNDSEMIRSDDNGATWFHTPQLTPSGSLVGYSLAFDPTRSQTVFLGGNGTPNVAKSLAGGAGWIDTGLPASGASIGYVYALAVDPKNSQTIYAGVQTSFGTGDKRGVWKSTNSGTTWAQLTGVPTGTAVHAVLIDPADSNILHVGSESGYYYSTDAGSTWTVANTGLATVDAQFINSLAMTGTHHLIAATNAGLYAFNLSAAPPPTVSSINPTSGNVAGGTPVTITGTGFDLAATVVTFGGVAATGVSVANSTTINAITPAHAAGAVNVVVQNPDGQTGTLSSGFTYTTALTAPANVSASATTATQVTIMWSAVDGATSYQVYRRSAGGGFVAINPTTTNTSYPDNGVTGGNSYLYLVRALNSSTSSPDSSADIATTILFTDDPIVAGSTSVKAVHLAEIRNAANAVRALGNQMLVTFTTGAASAGTIVTAAQINEVRTALDGGLNALGLSTGGYTYTLSAGVMIRAVDFQEIRNRTK